MKKKSNTRKIIFWCAIVVFFASVGVIGVEFYGSLKSKNKFSDLRELIDEETVIPESTTLSSETGEESTTQAVPGETETSEILPQETESDTETETVTEETTEKPKKVLKKYSKLYKLNNNMIGWIRINGTVIDYPVLWLEEDNDFYLEHDFYGEKSKYGQIILDYRCDFETPSTNLIFHGHHMADGMMFGSLRRYQKESYYNKHKYIQFDTIYEEGTYEIFAVFLTKIYNKGDKVFKYYNFVDAATEEEFDSYVASVKALSLYETGITPVYGDELITLSTCEYSQDNGRLVVVARRLSPEEAEKLSKK